jgi:hypothetical protein
MIDQDIKEAVDKAEAWYNKLPFEFHWDFSGFDDKELIRTAVESAYLYGYLDGKKS